MRLGRTRDVLGLQPKQLELQMKAAGESVNLLRELVEIGRLSLKQREDAKEEAKQNFRELAEAMPHVVFDPALVGP